MTDSNFIPPPDTLNARIGVLTRREVEARLLAPLVDALGEEFGLSLIHISEPTRPY